MSLCRLCKEREPLWLWKVFNCEAVLCFCLWDNQHIREGLPVCNNCKIKIEKGRETIEFRYLYKSYIVENKQVREI